VENQLLTVVESCGFTLSPKGVLATFAFPVFSVSSPRGSSLGFFAHGGGGRGCLVNVPRGIAVCAGPLHHRRVFFRKVGFWGGLLWEVVVSVQVL
jgi:hypothetical protein